MLCSVPYTDLCVYFIAFYLRMKRTSPWEREEDSLPSTATSSSPGLTSPGEAASPSELFDECAVCLRTSACNPACLEVCMHTFCLDCIRDWAKISNTCPLCKRRFSFVVTNIKSSKDFTKLTVEALRNSSTNLGIFSFTRVC